MKPSKVMSLMEVVRDCLKAGRYLDTRHALQRQEGRQITRPEILYVLKNGFHEKKKDHYEECFQAWNYAIRGKTLDNRTLRVVVSFDERSILIITAIDLDEGGTK